MDYYQILNVSARASDREIKLAYRTLVKKYHPDRNPSEQAREITAQLNEAYEVLSDPIKRSQYDNRFYQAFSEPVYEEDPREVYRREYVRRKQKEAKWEARRSEEKKKDFRHIHFVVARTLSFPLLALSFFLLLDRYSPTISERHMVVAGWQVRVTGGDTLTFLRTSTSTFEVPEHMHIRYDYDGDPEVPMMFKTSPLLHRLKGVVVDDGHGRQEFSPVGTPKNPYLVWPLFICSAMVALHRKYSPQITALNFGQLLFFIILMFQFSAHG
ncbi:DnaJ domain-containing protein [Chryseolinea serpens]|uniref:DnaJ domain-containing protein n=1 Tax=Chryseolinea serpens TaxID=947013 RepID=A0A1M5RN95_9BACT|nr:DnaJ domain-containing protein [Chryseolinea serpens]SHH27646.1 DnaJ domain-containing protein [Chryseolinea serpens]